MGGNLLFGSLPSSDRKKLKNELSRRLESRQASANAGLGAAFVATASPRLRPGEGRLALVLPVTVCTGPSWTQTRSLIERDYDLDMVITSHDPMRWNFSDSTALSEALLIATRRPRKKGAIERRTTFVNLWQNPEGVVGAYRMARAITTTAPAEIEGTGTALLEINNQHFGEVFSIPESKLAGKKWAGVQFARADVNRSALRLLYDCEVWVPGEGETTPIAMRRLDELVQIGPDVRRLSDGFDRTHTATAYPLVAGHDTEQRKSLICAPDEYLAPLAKPKGGQRPGYGERLWKQSSHLLIAERLWLETARVTAMRSGSRVLSNVWWSFKTQDYVQDKALAVWFNSTAGILSLLAIRNTTRGSWIKFKKADLKLMSIPDLNRLSPSQLQGLSRLFDEMAEEGVRAPAGDGLLSGPGAGWTRVSPRYWACLTWVSCGSSWRRSRWCLAGGCRDVGAFRWPSFLFPRGYLFLQIQQLMDEPMHLGDIKL